jgi:hypothetical protein
VPIVAHFGEKTLGVEVSKRATGQGDRCAVAVERSGPVLDGCPVPVNYGLAEVHVEYGRFVGEGANDVFANTLPSAVWLAEWCRAMDTLLRIECDNRIDIV